MEHGYLTFGEIYNQAARFVQDATSTFTTMVKAEIVDAYMQAAARYRWPELVVLKTTGLSFSTTTAKLYLPRDVSEVLAVVDTTNGQWVEADVMETILYTRPETFAQAGWALRYSVMADEGKQTEFYTAAEKLTVESSVSGDTNKDVRLAGIDSNGVRFTEVVGTNSSSGTTAVASTATFSDFLSASTDDTKTGVITVKGQTSATVYARIGPDEKTVRHKVLRIYQPPSSANAVALLYKKAVATLANDDDIPEIPVSHYLRKYATAKGLMFDGNHAAAQIHFQEAEKMLEEAMDHSRSSGDTSILSMPRQRPKFKNSFKIIRPN